MEEVKPSWKWEVAMAKVTLRGIQRVVTETAAQQHGRQSYGGFQGGIESESKSGN
jgi:hypothetical protein